MKKQCITLISCLCAAACLSPLTASATTVGDVIAHAYAVGLPESTIQECISMYSGGEYTSAQCDSAIAALDQWAASCDDAISDVVEEGNDSDSSDTEDPTEIETDTTEDKQQETKTSKQDSDTGSDTASSDSNTSGADISTDEFINMTIDEKVDYINSLSSDEKEAFMNNMSNEERNSFVKQMSTTKQAEILSQLLGLGDAFDLNFSVDTINDDAVSISVRDDDGNLVSVAAFGDVVEETGKPYTIPVVIGAGLILLGAGGIGFLTMKGKKEQNHE